jgi:kynurenine 3-monooxygenase
MPRVTIIGAGLAGSLLAIYLARRGFGVDVFEARPDMRKTDIGGGRSINLALSDRGIAALREVGMDEYMLAEAVPMYGRMIHSPTGDTKLLPYSGRKGEYINSVSRAGLNIALMNEAEKYPGVRFYFDHRCTGFNAEMGDATFENGQTAIGDTLIATDGAGSAVRYSMQQCIPSFQISEVFLEHGYKELHIPAGSKGEFLIEKNALHIWPRHKFMMIALPNFDGSFTCTLFLSIKGGNATARDGASSTVDEKLGFDQLLDPGSVVSFFEREFPDAVPLMPTLIEDFFHNPTGHLGTVKCWPWNFDGKALLLGDSAHAMVPFYGQGMNCAFEDVRVLSGLIDDRLSTAETPRRGDNNIDWNIVFNEYCSLRKPNTDAIQDMAEENFYEMRDATADPVFQRKRELETRLEQTYPDYFSKYSMVTFREDMPYAVAKEKGNAQDRLLMELCSQVSSVDELDPYVVMNSVRGISVR